MTDEAYGATVAKHASCPGASCSLRVQSGYTANHVCDMLPTGAGAEVGRFEANQWKRPEMSDIRDLLRIYDVDEGEREQLEELAIQARARPWWRDYSDIFENEFPGFENDASRIRVFMPLVLPGLLRDVRTTPRLSCASGHGHRPGAVRCWTPRQHGREILSRPGDTAPDADRRHHRGVPAVPVGLAIGPARPDRASDRHGPPSQHRPPHPAVHRWPAAGPDVGDQHL